MLLLIGIEGDTHGAELRSLYAWLRETGRWQVFVQPSPSQQGSSQASPTDIGGAEADQLVVELRSTDLGSFVTTLILWLQLRKRGLTITVGRPGGAQVRFSGTPTETALNAVVNMLQNTSPGPPFGDDDDEW